MSRPPAILIFAWSVWSAVAQAPTARQHADAGVELAQKGDLAQAEAELRRAVALEPRNSAYLSALGAVLGGQHKLEESSALLEKALGIDPHDSAARRNLASNQFQMGKLPEARRNLEIVLRERPGDKTAVLLAGMVAEEQKDYATAIRRLESVPELVRERAESIAALARACYQTGDGAKARNVLAWMHTDRVGAAGVFLGAQIAAANSDFATAERMFASVRSQYPDRARLEYELALVQYRVNHYAESLATLRRLTADGHQSSVIFNLMAWCLYKQGNFQQAVAAMDLAIEREPAQLSNYIDLGMILLSHRRVSVAMEVAGKAVAVAPSSSQAYMLKGLVEARMSHLNDAERTYEQAVALNPQAPEPVLALAIVESANEKKQQSEATFQNALKRFPRNAVLHQEYARMLLKFAAGSDSVAKTRAVSLLEQAISLDGSLAESHYQLGQLAIDDGDPDRALTHLNAAVQLLPRSSKIHFALARAYRRKGLNDSATKELAQFQKWKAEEERAFEDTAEKGSSPGRPDFPAQESNTGKPAGSTEGH
jgi:tetratricopeptide (TPR) repeat protein